jgi:hypothetical protein
MKILLLLLTLAAVLAAAPIGVYPANTRYYEWRGKPAILVTSGEHYGAVLNGDFDYRKYLATLGKDRLNLTRIFTGVYREAPGDFGITRNTLAPRDEAFVAPYAKGAGGKFDLNRWNPAYWARLHSFIEEAHRLGIVVEVTIFCVYYQDRMWELSPWHARNNVNGTPEAPREEVLSLKHPAYVAIQEAFIRKLASELSRHDNVIFEITNEPYVTNTPADWQAHMAGVAKAALPRHLVGQNIANFTKAVVEPDANVAFLNFHYARPPVAVAENWRTGRIIGLDETGFDGTLDAVYRIQGWDFLMAGGAHYNNLDYSFVVGHEDGTFLVPGTAPGGGSVALREQLGILRRFFDGIPFAAMKPAEVVVGEVAAGWSVRALAGEGVTAVYVHSGQVHPNRRPRYSYATTSQAMTLRLNLAAGRYEVSWWDTRSGKTERTTLAHDGGHATLATPVFSEDIALLLVRSQ